MKCEICGARKAVIHIQQVIGKERVDLHLCEECALERGISGEGERVELSISGMLNGLLEIGDLKEKRDLSEMRIHLAIDTKEREAGLRGMLQHLQSGNPFPPRKNGCPVHPQGKAPEGFENLQAVSDRRGETQRGPDGGTETRGL